MRTTKSQKFAIIFASKRAIASAQAPKRARAERIERKFSAAISVALASIFSTTAALFDPYTALFAPIPLIGTAATAGTPTFKALALSFK